jgi:hypothetical protein
VAYRAGLCNAVSAPASWLNAMRRSLPDPATHRILPERISKGAFGPVVRSGDDQWFQIVQWTLFALIDAEEAGVTSRNIESLQAAKTHRIRRLLGLEGSVRSGDRARQPISSPMSSGGRQLRRNLRPQFRAEHGRRAWSAARTRSGSMAGCSTPRRSSSGVPATTPHPAARRADEGWLQVPSQNPKRRQHRMRRLSAPFFLDLAQLQRADLARIGDMRAAAGLEIDVADAHEAHAALPIGGLTFIDLMSPGLAASSSSVIHSAVTGSAAATRALSWLPPRRHRAILAG